MTSTIAVTPSLRFFADLLYNKCATNRTNGVRANANNGQKKHDVLSPIHTGNLSRRIWRLSRRQIVAVSGDYSRQGGQGFTTLWAES